MAEDKRRSSIKGQATYPLIPGLTPASISEAIEAALNAGNAGPPLRIRRGRNADEFRLELQRNIRFSTGNKYITKNI
ncbi:unnamed protein product [Rotaria sordida]|uniref:Uncharacterized protein n=1 Tax=Rotaria sordida TaxID=392033 RepID=A0A815WQJ9_9BILA|nr:unnamed protein product [Rotaria sordida]CAF1549025.1 unnamed protein product [Rotaria sordida]